MSPEELELSKKIDEEADLAGLSDELKEVAIGKQGIFYKYRNKKEIGQKIFDAYVDYNKQHVKGKELYKYIFSDDFAQVGTLSELQGFQTILTLVQEFDLKVDININEMIERVFEYVINPVTKQPNFNLSPYTVGKSFFESGEHAYLDSLTWFISAMLSVFRIYIKGGYDIKPELLDKCIIGYKRGMKYLNDSFISSGKVNNQSFDLGWNFTDGAKNPSLYYTFAVSEVLIDISSTFPACIGGEYEVKYVKNRIAERLNEYANKYPELRSKIEEEIDIRQKKIEEDKAEEIAQFSSKNDESAIRERELFEKINVNEVTNSPYDFDNNSPAPYQTLERRVKEAAEDIWSIVRGDLSKDFFSYNLGKVSVDSIDQGTSNDAIFNTIFIINTIINAGLDEDREDEINFYTLSNYDAYDPVDKSIVRRYEEALSEYDEMVDSLRLAYEHAYQVYNDFLKKNKEYKVDEFSVTLDENFESELNKVAKDIRKAHIRVFSLMPLLIKTKTLMSDFVIRYPQYDMQIYLEKILQHRVLNKNNDYLWIWETDNYSSSSNYYYISALASFFKYYETYEEKFITISKENDEIRQKIEEAYLMALKSHGGEIFNLKQQLNANEDRIKTLSEDKDKLQTEINKLSDPTYAMNVAIQGILQKSMYEMIGKMFSNAAGNIENKTYNNIENEEIQSDVLVEGFKKFILSLAAKQILESTGGRNIESRKNNVQVDMDKAFDIYVNQVVKDGVSSYVQHEGFKEFSEVLQKLDEKDRK